MLILELIRGSSFQRVEGWMVAKAERDWFISFAGPDVIFVDKNNPERKNE